MLVKDNLMAMHAFGVAVAKALTDAKVRPSAQADVCAVMVVVGSEESREPPLGGAINYDTDTESWSLADQLSLAEAVG